MILVTNCKSYYHENDEKLNGLSLIQINRHRKSNIHINVNNDIIIYRVLCEKNNIQARTVWHLNHMQKCYKNFQSYKIKNANILIKNSFCLPSGSNLRENDQKKVINTIKKILTFISAMGR